ncbi:MAG TPA: electron transport complex subunit E [Clostridiales bacterium]|jgi:electron transport complex protein RnfE|nr:electron transport complex subunit E [Clostridiales bacterium]
MNKYLERLVNGLFKENPTFVLMLGMCPTLAVTVSAWNGVGMGLSTTAVLVASNVIIAALRRFIPNTVRMPYFIVVVASMVTIVQLLLQAYFPSVSEALGIYIPLIVVNCIIFGRVEAYAAKNKVGLSLFDGIGMGIGFTIALILIGSFRELLGAGTIFNFRVMPSSYEPIEMFIKPPGAFLVLAMLTALQNKFKLPSATNGSGKKSALTCGGDCANCMGEAYAINHELNAEEPKIKKAVRKED